jgi:hypothetical protein
MHPADKALLRLAVGVGVSVVVAYGLKLAAPFVACVLATFLLAKPGPPMPFAKGAVLGAIVAAVLAAGLLMVPLLVHYRFAGLLLTGVLLYAVVRAGARQPGPLAPILLITFAVIPVAGVLDQGLAIALAKAFGAGLAVGALVSGLSHAFFPDDPRQAAAPAAAAPRDAHWLALQATAVILPVFMLALSNPALYIATIMKAVALGQQAGATDARSAGRELVGSTLMGGILGAAVWFGLSILPNLWMLTLWITAATFWAGARMVRIRASRFPPSFWLNALVTMFIVLGPGIEDAMVGKDVFKASATRLLLYVAISFYAWGAVWLFGRLRAVATRQPA